MNTPVVDHLFRHQYGKMIAILTSIFGLDCLELIEDAVQDTFIKASVKWRRAIPDNPEAWLMQAAKNRAVDLLRKVKADKLRNSKISSGAAAIHLQDHFLDHEVEDSQLRMIFVACYPALAPEEQIAFALKTIAGFSMREIAAALLNKEETIKKRLSRARKTISEKGIKFEYPSPKEINVRLDKVLHVIYLIFNEGFHSTRSDQLVSKDLCGEAMRLAKLLLKKERFRSGSLYALFALMCFHAARLEQKVVDGEILDLQQQDRSKWYFPLIVLGDESMSKALGYSDLSPYHFEACIAAEHIKARSFDATNWQAILDWYVALDHHFPNVVNRLQMAIVRLQMKQPDECYQILKNIDFKQLEQRSYLYFGALAECHFQRHQVNLALENLDLAIQLTTNASEKKYLLRKRNTWQ